MIESENKEPMSPADPEYDAVISRAREAMAAIPDLSPSQWVEIRGQVDTVIEGPPSSGMGWAWMAAGVAAAAALVLSMSPPPSSGLPAPETSVEVPLAAATPPPAVAPAQASRAIRIQPGQVLSAGAAATTHDAFGRHHLTLAPGGVMEVVAWSERDLVVRLSAGQVTADIAKAYPGERIQIETATAVVRVVGTQFSVAVEPSGATRVNVTEGIVEVRDQSAVNDAPVRITAGQTHRVAVSRPAPATPVTAPPRTRRASRKVAPSTADETPTKGKGGFRVIEIDVPPQQAPNAR